jgi:hypothetical protein
MTSVYKYRGLAELRRDLKSLFLDYFFAPTASQLNDPTEAVLNDKLPREVEAGTPNRLQEAFQNLKRMRHTVGIYSLSRTATDELMWARYADSHQGYCIEYNLERLILDARDQWDVLNVTYSDDPSSLSVFEATFGYNHETIARPLVGCKSRRWEYEREVRIITSRADRNHYARAAVTGIYFGCRCAEETMTRIRRYLQGRAHAYSVMQYPEHTYQLAVASLARSEIDGALSYNMAPVQNGAIVSKGELGEYEAKYPLILRAVEHVSRDLACKSIVYANVSTMQERRGQIFVQYETRVKTDLSEIVTWRFTDEELQSEDRSGGGVSSV